MASCLKKTRTAIAVLKAVVSRALFVLHGFICIWRVTVVKGEPLYWCLTGTIPLMVLETVFTLKLKKGGEWKWVCPSVFLYLGTSVPAIWFLELDLMQSRMTPHSGAVTVSTVPLSRDVQDDTISDVLNGQLNITLSLGVEEWCKVLEQMLLLLLIVGRWLLPKGEITREQLSQLLLVYIGMAADIIELFEAFKEEEVRQNSMLTLIILALWTASLTQFTFVLTATKSKRSRLGFQYTGSVTSPARNGGKSCCKSEVLSIIISMVLQDGPFLVLRVLLILRYDVLSYTNIFFTCKNTLVLVLQFYRLVVLFSQAKQDDPMLSKGQEQLEEPDMSQRAEGISPWKPDPASARFSSEEDTTDGKEPMFEKRKGITSVDGLGRRRLDVKAGLSDRSPNITKKESLIKRQGRRPTEPSSSKGAERKGNYSTKTPTTLPLHPSSDTVKRPEREAEQKTATDNATRGNVRDIREVHPKDRDGGRTKTEAPTMRSGREQWQDIQIVAKSIAFISETGKYHTLFLKPVGTHDNHVTYVLEPDGGDEMTKYG